MYAAGRIIDISDERRPRIVSHPITQSQAENGGGAFYCTPDRQLDPTVIGCTSWSGSDGFRAYDVRDINDPKEIAYYSAPMNDSGSAAFLFPEDGLAVYADQNYGLTIVRFTQGTWPFGGSSLSEHGPPDEARATAVVPIAPTSERLAAQQSFLLLCGLPPGQATKDAPAATLRSGTP